MQGISKLAGNYGQRCCHLGSPLTNGWPMGACGQASDRFAASPCALPIGGIRQLGTVFLDQASFSNNSQSWILNPNFQSGLAEQRITVHECEK